LERLAAHLEKKSPFRWSDLKHPFGASGGSRHSEN
jgi:hypothetical protein